MADLPDEARRIEVETRTPLLDDSSAMSDIAFVDGILCVRTEDGCLHQVPEESLSRWSKWKNPGTGKWSLKIWTDSGALPVIEFNKPEQVDSACATLCEIATVEGF